MIGKTRRQSAAADPLRHDAEPGPGTRTPSAVGAARGVLPSQPLSGAFHHARHLPPAQLQPFVQHLWIVRWDLRGQAPQVRETLPHPSVHLIFERALTRIYGVHTVRYTRVLEGEGCVFGVKFRPGGFRPFLRRPLSTLADSSLALPDVFGAASIGLEGEVLACGDELGMIDVVTRFFAQHLPPADADIDRAADIVDQIDRDRRLTTVEAVVARSGLGKRALQRLFNEYVGVGPKWVINRFRLHEAIEQLAAGKPLDWSVLALDLGYFDQAHFIHDFRKLVGRTPAQYVREIAANAAPTQRE
ncbi:MAG: AraC family transcriptional regulator [Dokdonella sp.]